MIGCRRCGLLRSFHLSVCVLFKTVLQIIIEREIEIQSADKTEGDNPFKPSDSKGNYSATSNNTKLVHWPLVGGLYQI